MSIYLLIISCTFHRYSLHVPRSLVGLHHRSSPRPHFLLTYSQRIHSSLSQTTPSTSVSPVDLVSVRPSLVINLIFRVPSLSSLYSDCSTIDPGRRVYDSHPLQCIFRGGGRKTSVTNYIPNPPTTRTFPSEHYKFYYLW